LCILPDCPNLPDLIAHVRPDICHIWDDVGLTLSIAEGKLKEIKANSPTDVRQCCREMFSHWLSKDLDASWEKLMTALESPGIEQNRLAEAIRHKLTPGMSKMYLNVIRNRFMYQLHRYYIMHIVFY